MGEGEPAMFLFHPQELWIALGTTVLLAVLLIWRQFQALDSTKNNSGICAWSPLHYKVGGPIQDFINAMPFLLNLVPTASVFAGIFLREVTGNDYWTFFTFLAGFVGVPLLDLVVGEDSYNPTPEEESALRKNKWFSFHLCFYVWVYVVEVLAVSYYIGVESGYIGGGGNNLSHTALVGITTSVGIASGFGIGCIHELLHRPTFFEMNHSRIVLLLCNYNHFWVEHNWGHHKRVATDEDPASSALNESFWTFIWCCMYKSFVSAVRLETKFQSNRGRGFFTLQNRILVPFFVSFTIDYAIYYFCGPKAFAFQMLQSLLTIMLTDNANYIEHYGLRRKRLSDKKDEWGLFCDYERPGWMHAWNTGDRISNWILFKIERHPDHHVNAGRPYQILRTYKESPTYPTGYAGMFVLSWFPPLFFMVMNPLVRKAHADLEKMQADGSYHQIFPTGSNNISTAYKKQGEDFFEKGSSEYGGGIDADIQEDNMAGVWIDKKKV